MSQSDNKLRTSRRGFSVSQGNESIVSEVRSNILDEIEEADDQQAPFLKHSANMMFLLPNLFKYHCQLRAFLEKDLIEQSSLLHLETSKRLNWWCANECIQRLWPLATTGDGNCLLHAASLAMWGFHDRHLTLRHLLHHRLIQDNMAFYKRWAYYTVSEQRNQGFSMSQTELQTEWSEICNLSFPSPKGTHEPEPFTFTGKEVNQKPLSCCSSTDNSLQRDVSNKARPLEAESRDSYYDFLEQIHVFVLAQVLHRPIIIFSDTFVRDADGEPIQPLNFGGLYLPLLEKPENCEKSPILLAYSNSHFSALVPMSSERDDDDRSCLDSFPLSVPLVDPVNWKLLPIHFAVDPGNEWLKDSNPSDSQNMLAKTSKELLSYYLDCEEFRYCSSHKQNRSVQTGADGSNSDSSSDGQKRHSTKNIGRQIKARFSTKKKSKSSSDKVSVKKPVFSKQKDSKELLAAKLTIRLPYNYSEMIGNYFKSAKIDFEELEKKNRRTSMELMDKLNNNRSCESVHSTLSICKETTSTIELCSQCSDDKGSTNSNKSKACMNKSCSAMNQKDGYCSKCYENLPACKECTSKAISQGLCTSCNMKQSKVS